MGFLGQKEIQSLAKYIGSDLCRKWEGLQKKFESGDVVTIANTGMVNSGKSSLFNVLLDDFEEKRFPVGAVRTTLSGDREHFADQIDFVDTPGIDVNDTDDAVAYDTLMQSDMILMVHNVKTGMLNKSEFDWLKRIADSLSAEQIQKRFVFVCTWTDERDKQNDYISLIAEIKRMMMAALGTDADFWEVSSKRYRTAHQKNNKNLAEKSNIPQLKQFLLDKARAYQKELAKDRQKQLEILAKQTTDVLQNKRIEYSNQYARKREQIERKYYPMFSTWRQILENFTAQRSDIKKKQSNL